MGRNQLQLWKIFEGDLEGAGYPRNEKARQGEVLGLGYFQVLTASSGQEKPKEMHKLVQTPGSSLSDTREKDKAGRKAPDGRTRDRGSSQ